MVICMEILALLLDGPRGPSKLAQGVGLNYDELLKFASLLESKQFIRKELQEGHQLYHVTPAGVTCHADCKKIHEALEL